MGVKDIFGTNLKYYRKKNNLSQAALSEKLDISTKHLSAIETGSAFVSADLLENISIYLGIPISYLFYVPGQNQNDELLLNDFEMIVENELKKTFDSIKSQITSKCIAYKNPVYEGLHCGTH